MPLIFLYLYLYIFFLGFFSNKNVPQEKTQNPLSYTMEKEELKECVEETCAEININYPVFHGESLAVKRLNQQIEEKLIIYFQLGEFTAYEDKEIAVKNIFNSYRRFREEFSTTAQEWKIDTDATVTYQRGGLLSIRFENYSFTGSAHPNSSVLYLNYDIGKGELLGEEELLIDKVRMLALAEEKFREYHEVKEGVALEEDGRFFLEDGRFFLPMAIGYEGNNFVLLYNKYEIGPYSMGETELKFSIDELEGVVRQL